MTLSKIAIAFGIITLAAAAAFAAEDHNSSRSNLSQKIPVGGEPTLVKHSYKFKWTVDAGNKKLLPKERKILLKEVFKQIQKDVLR